MLRRRWFLLFGAVAVLFLVLGGCKTEADGPSAPPPPSAAELPPLDEGVTFPTGPAAEDEAGALVTKGMGLVTQSLSSVFEEIFTDLFGGFFGSDEDPSYSLARAIDESLDKPINKTIPGATVTGSVKGAVKSSLSLPEEGFENFNPTPGDYAEGNLNAEINLNITDLKDAGLAVKGKASVNGSAQGKLSLTESGVSLIGNLNADGSYGLTISDGSSGVKAAASLTIRADINKTISQEEISGYFGEDGDMDAAISEMLEQAVKQFDCSIIIYDDSNVEQFKQNITLDDILKEFQL